MAALLSKKLSTWRKLRSPSCLLCGSAATLVCILKLLLNVPSASPSSSSSVWALPFVTLPPHLVIVIKCLVSLIKPSEDPAFFKNGSDVFFEMALLVYLSNW